MTAKYVVSGQPAHDLERQALRFLVDGLPAAYTVYGNPWLIDRNGAVYELDAVVVAPHAVYVVEIKTYRARIEGTDHDWYLPHPVPSPLRLNQLTSQVLKSQLKRDSYQAGQVWVQGFVFLSATTDVGVKGPASRDRVHTRRTILAALQDTELVERLSHRRSLAPTDAADQALYRLFQGAQDRPRPLRQIREYEIVETLDHHDAFTELLGRNRLSGDERVLRVYRVPELADEEQRRRVEKRARWEAQVLGRLGRCEGILNADPPFADEAGIVLPLEHFPGVTLATWLERHGPAAPAKERADLRQRTDLWIRLARTLDEANHQGIVHRLLRPDVILVDDRADPASLRVTGFDLAKQLAADTTVAFTALGEERLVFAAPEVVAAFSSAQAASDQFSLGAILALLLTGKPLFESTRKLTAARRLMRHVRDVDARIPQSLDDAVSRMLELRPTDRFPSLADAIKAVSDGRERQAHLPGLANAKAPLDPDNLAEGTRVGPDYEIASRLGEGGMAVVYAARHLASGRTRALKIARPDDAAEEALRGEHQVLSALDHPNVVKVVDLSKMVEGRLTLVMERVGGRTLRRWLADNPTPAAATRRRLAEDLLAGLDYLEQQGVTHKDLKPENLLVDDGSLIIIDFSLAALPDDDAYAGTALYRDPAAARWSHATDRFAAALCLFEIYAGRHAFDGRVPEPGEAPEIDADDVEPPGLANFFKKALAPSPEARFPSARALRDALLVYLGEDVETTAPPPAEAVDADTPLRLTGLSHRAVNALARSRVHTVGQLLGLSDEQVRSIHAIGAKTAADVVAFQDTQRRRGLQPTSADVRLEQPLLAELADSPEPVSKLSVSGLVFHFLEEHGLPTIGAVAGLTRTELLAVPGLGRKRLAEVVDALYRFRDQSPDRERAHTLDSVWNLASGPLTERQRVVVERVVGLFDEPARQAAVAADLDVSQGQVSSDCSAGIERLDRTVLADVLDALDAILDSFGGVVRVDEIARRLEDEWPAGVVSGAAIVRLLARVSAGRQVHELEGAEGPVLARTGFDRATLTAFVHEVGRVAAQWPPVAPESARRALAALLPHYDGDPLALGVRLAADVEVASTGHLFVGPLQPRQSLRFVLDQLRDPIPLDELERRVRHTFGSSTPYPDAAHLVDVLRELDCRVEGRYVHPPGSSASVVAAPPHAADEVPGRGYEQTVLDSLKDAAATRGFRMLVVPPERHAEIGRSVARALDAVWISFEDAFFTRHAADLSALERAERFKAQREALTEAAETVLFELLEEHGRADRTLVLGDVALLGLCEALDLPRRLYDETLSGDRGFWILVVPGVIHNRQPLFNEATAMWHLEGATQALLNPLP